MQVEGTEWKFGVIFKKIKKRREKRKKRCVAQQGVNLTKTAWKLKFDSILFWIRVWAWFSVEHA